MSYSLEHLLVITGGYPSQQRPADYTFVDQLVRALAQLGPRCSVVSPVAIHDHLSGQLPPHRDKITSNGTKPISVLRPRYISVSNRRFGPLRAASITQLMFERAVLRALRSIDPHPNALYGHFLYASGATAARLGCRLGIPSFVAVGESSFWSVRPYGFERARRDFRDITGCIAVSSLLKREMVSKLNIPSDRVRVFPNGVDLRKFYPHNKSAMREAFGFPRDTFIVAFVGHFTDRKGVLRVAEAIRGLKGVDVVFAGSGPLVPEGSNILFKGVLPHNQVPHLLSAADVFVLPTKREGCCNAILEALACGLPVVTSDREFNDGIIDGTVGIRVDPLSVEAIREAVRTLRDDPNLRQQMSSLAHRKAQCFSIRERAGKMLDWMQAEVVGASATTEQVGCGC